MSQRKSSATRNSLGICAGSAVKRPPNNGVLVSPLTYGYAPSAKRPQVYSALAEQHGKMACVVWQTEWQDGPGVVEHTQLRPSGAVPLDERLLRSTRRMAMAGR